MTMVTALSHPIQKKYASWWRTDSYFNNKQIQIGGIEIVTAAYGSSGSFVLRVR